MLWGLAQSMAKARGNEEPVKLRSHIGASAKEIYFSSSKNPLYQNPAPVDASVTAKVKAFLQREKLRVATNFEVSTSERLRIVATWWMDGYLLSTKFTDRSTRSLEMVAEGGLTQDDKTFRLSASLSFRAFGLDVKKYEATTNRGIRVKIPMPKLELDTVVYGVPEAGLTAHLALKPVVEIAMELDARATHKISMSFAPKLSLLGEIGGGAQASKAIAAKALGILEIIAAEFPFTAALGGSKTAGYIYGGATYDGQIFSALTGQLVLVANIGAKDGLLPLGLDKHLWTFVQRLFEKIHIKVPNIFIAHEFTHIIWAGKPVFLRQAAGYEGKAFFKIFATPQSATCLPLQTAVKSHVDLLTREMATDTGRLKEMDASAIHMLTSLKDKIRVRCK